MNIDRRLPMRIKRVKHAPPCSRCGNSEYSGSCACGEYFCAECIEPHFTEDDPDFCSVLRTDPDRPDLMLVGKIDWKVRQ